MPLCHTSVEISFITDAAAAKYSEMQRIFAYSGLGYRPVTGLP